MDRRTAWIRPAACSCLLSLLVVGSACDEPQVVTGPSPVDVTPLPPAPDSPPSGVTTVSLSGTVSNAAASGSTPVAHARIDIFSGADSGRSAATDGAGHYEIAGLTSGPLSVRASADGYDSQSRDATLSANVVIDFALVASASASPPPPAPVTFVLSGTVSDAIAQSHPLAGARIEVTAGANTGQSAAADGSGQYAMTLHAGAFSVRVSASAYTAATASGTLGANQTLDVALMPSSTANARGRAVDAVAETGLGGIAISGDNLSAAPTDSTGAFTVVAAQPMTYDVVFSGPAVVERHTTLAVPTSNAIVPLIPSNFDLQAFDEMFRTPFLRRWQTAPPLHLELRTLQFSTTGASEATAVEDDLSSAKAAVLLSDLSWALPRLTGGTFGSFATVTQADSAPGTSVTILNPGWITVCRIAGLTAATGYWGYARWLSTDDGTVTGGLVMIDRDFDESGSSFARSLRAHELGHALGYDHVTVRPSVMNADARTEPNGFDLDAAKVAFDRPPGNRSPDVDPEPTSRPSRSRASSWSQPMR